MKIGFGLAAGVVIVVAIAVMVLAWAKGGAQPSQSVEIPVSPATGQAGGA